MLAGYLPFDDDPANPEGDNINLLYKYIVNTPLTFPEYVTPHARDLLRRILVPDPRKRADLFEVARHSWLSEYSHVVGFITSNTTTTLDIGSTTVGAEAAQEPVLLGRSASVREPSKPQKSQPTMGDLSRKHGGVDQDTAEQHPKTQKDNKRRTVQVEYVAPRSQTQRGESSAAPSQSSRTRARAGSQGPVEVPGNQNTSKRAAVAEKPLPQDPPVLSDAQYAAQVRQASSSQRQVAMPAPSRPGREPARAASDTNYKSAAGQPTIARPNTGGSMTSSVSRSGSMGLPSLGPYSQPVAPIVEGTNVHGRISQPKILNAYNISSPTIPDDENENESDYGRPSVSQVPPKFAKLAGPPGSPLAIEQRGHKRSSTIGSIFSRTNSIFGGKSKIDRAPERQQEKLKKSYPPVSMPVVVGEESRPSLDSRRSISFGFTKKRSGSVTGSNPASQDKPKRFSLLPASFSLKSIGIGKEYDTPGTSHSEQQFGHLATEGRGSHLEPPQTAREMRQASTSTTDNHYQGGDAMSEGYRDSPLLDRGVTSSASLPQHQRFVSQGDAQETRTGAKPQLLAPINFRQDKSILKTESESSFNDSSNRRAGPYPTEVNNYQDNRQTAVHGNPAEANNYDNSRGQAGRGNGRGVLQKNNRKFADAYEQDPNSSYGVSHSDSAGSSGAARKVMDFFRRRGKARGDDR